MNSLHKLRSRGNENLCLLPLFAWAASQSLRSHPRVVKSLSTRFGLSPALALTVAELAGFSTEAHNA
ncbi:hypothetical protein [Microvirga sp. BSC39]|uniref:hypothetical protein n=1 Tax=Microvirga sp. BSC39 TaxID=1549810 RepID=UPI0004E926ED|nr:hypothetical protein [Microvirga sp. BSC39]KFG70378.1 hypothetical protein JH26_04940 [Microvirga sp. BSC39]